MPAIPRRDPLHSLRLADVLTFLAVRRHGSITKAARERGVTASQVSKAVTRLEGELCTSLVLRSAKGVVISETGHRVVPHLEQVVVALRRARGEEPAAGVLTFAAPSYLATLLLPCVAARQPELQLRALELAPALVRAYATENLFDVALAVGPPRMPPSWVCVEVGEVCKRLFGPPELVRRLGPGPVPPARLGDVPFVAPIYCANGEFIPADDDCPLSRAERRRGHEAQTLALALQLAVAAGQLVFGPRIAARELVRDGRLVEVKVIGWDVREPLHLACNGDRVRAKTQQAIATALRRRLTELDGPASTQLS